jgi:dGTPase
VSNRFDRQRDIAAHVGDVRSRFERDRDRILYSSALRRLSGVTQVVAPTEGQLIHNRLTHSLEVMQIGRGLGEYLLHQPEGPERASAAGGLDVAVVEAAGLAHDLGHPPFGHVAETALKRCLAKEDGKPIEGCDPTNLFEGNAQSFRILTRLAVRYDDFPGLNLTRAVLCATLKYPWVRAEAPDGLEKWGAYTTELEDLIWARELVPAGMEKKRSLEAAVMDWADDVAYAVHDMEDFVRAGLIPLDRLVVDSEERDRFLEGEFKRRNVEAGSAKAESIRTVFAELMEFGPSSTPYRGTHGNRAELRSFTSYLVNRYITAVSLVASGYGEDAMSIADFALEEVAVLKGLTWFYVINSRSLAAQRRGQQRLVHQVFSDLMEAALSIKEIDWAIFPEYYRERLVEGASDDDKPRIVADVISGMSEAQLIGLHQRLTGTELGSSKDPIL